MTTVWTVIVAFATLCVSVCRVCFVVCFFEAAIDLWCSDEMM